MIYEDNIFVFGDYVPTGAWQHFRSEKKEFSKKLLDFKEGKFLKTKYFAVCIKNLIQKSKYWHLDVKNTLFVPIPCSKAKNNIPNNYKNDPERGVKLLKFISNDIKHFYFVELITRTYSIDESHSKDSLITTQDQYKSLAVIKHNLPLKTIVLLDDIYTHGHTFNACCRLLKEKGYNHIYGLMLGKRVQLGDVLEKDVIKQEKKSDKDQVN